MKDHYLHGDALSIASVGLGLPLFLMIMTSLGARSTTQLN